MSLNQIVTDILQNVDRGNISPRNLLDTLFYRFGINNFYKEPLPIFDNLVVNTEMDPQIKERYFNFVIQCLENNIIFTNEISLYMNDKRSSRRDLLDSISGRAFNFQSRIELYFRFVLDNKETMDGQTYSFIKRILPYVNLDANSYSFAELIKYKLQKFNQFEFTQFFIDLFNNGFNLNKPLYNICYTFCGFYAEYDEDNNIYTDYLKRNSIVDHPSWYICYKSSIKTYIRSNKYNYTYSWGDKNFDYNFDITDAYNLKLDDSFINSFLENLDRIWLQYPGCINTLDTQHKRLDQKNLLVIGSDKGNYCFNEHDFSDKINPYTKKPYTTMELSNIEYFKNRSKSGKKAKRNVDDLSSMFGNVGLDDSYNYSKKKNRRNIDYEDIDED